MVTRMMVVVVSGLQDDGTVRLWWVLVPMLMELSGRGG